MINLRTNPLGIKKCKQIIAMGVIMALVLTLTSGIASSNPDNTRTGEEVVVADSAESSGTTPEEGGEAVPTETTILTVNPEDKLSQMTLEAENDALILYFDPKTADVAVKDKASSNTWFSNPIDAEYDARASDDAKKLLKSQLRLTYYTKKVVEKEINSWTECVLLEQFSATKLPNGLKVEMRIGREESRRLLPYVIIRENFESILEKVPSEKGQRRLKAFYKLYSLKDAIDEKQKKEWLQKFPILEEHDVYAIKSVTEREKGELEGYIKEAGYTFEDLEEEYKRMDFEVDEEAFPFFKVTLEYLLEGDTFVVRIPEGGIEYDTKTFRLQKVHLFQYFGTAKAGEDGYIFVPDGSGTLINFNDGSKETPVTTGRVYGLDNSLEITPGSSFSQDYRFPVYGIKSGEKGMLAVIEKGDAMAEIQCELGGFTNSYNTVYSSFIIKSADRFKFADATHADSSWMLLDKNSYEGDMKIRYHFLNKEDAGYVGMAKAYRSYLEKNGTLKKLSVNDNLPFYLETLGTVDRKERILGIPMDVKAPLTTFSDAKKLVEALKEENIQNIQLRYKGWYNGGLDYKAPAILSVEGKLGGKKGLSDLNQYLKERGVGLYPDVDFILVSNDGLFDGFSARNDASRTLDRKYSGYRDINLGTNLFRNSTFKYSISPRVIGGYFDKFLSQYNKLDIQGISVGTMGSFLNSDFKEKKAVHREEAKEVVYGCLQKADKSNMNLMVDGGNAYVLPYTEHILNMPLEDSAYMVSDRRVPFMQIVLHGYVQYAGTPLNLSGDYKKAVLKSIESGAAPYFVMTYQNASKLKDTAYSRYYAVNYMTWLKEAGDVYKKMNDLLKDVQKEAITDHREVVPDVYVTTYESGKAVIVNYGETEVRVEGTTVKPVDFAVLR